VHSNLIHVIVVISLAWQATFRKGSETGIILERIFKSIFRSLVAGEESINYRVSIPPLNQEQGTYRQDGPAGNPSALGYGSILVSVYEPCWDLAADPEPDFGGTQSKDTP
jgi:hypothetical protein